MKMSNGKDSETRLPQCVKSGSLVFYDLPGFQDTRGATVELANASIIKYLIENAKTVRLVFVAGQDEITSTRGDSFKELLTITKNLFPKSNAIANSSLLVITKSIKRTAPELLEYLSPKRVDQDQVSTWLHPNKISPMSKTLEESQKRNILEKINFLPPSQINMVNIEVIYNLNIRSNLQEIFSKEMKEYLDQSLNKAPTDDSTTEKIMALKMYFAGPFEQNILTGLENSSIILLLQPLSPEIFAEEKDKFLIDVTRYKKSNLDQAEIKEKQLVNEALSRQNASLIQLLQSKPKRKKWYKF